MNRPGLDEPRTQLVRRDGVRAALDPGKGRLSRERPYVDGQKGSRMIRYASRDWNAIMGVCSAAFVLLVVAGCAHVNNPWVDSGAAINSEMTTASTEGYRAGAGAAGPLHQSQRQWSRSEVRQENGAVSHWPLWFEDPFEDKGNAYKAPADRDAPDVEFAWNGLDYLHIPYGPGRMIFVNTAAWPISAAVTPPGTLMESDGHVDKGLVWYDHDAKRADSAVREPPDVNVINKARRPEVVEPTDTPEGAAQQ